MSWLSNATGVHISKKGVKIEPLKALGTVATLGSFGALGPVAGLASSVGGKVLSKIPGASKVAGAIEGAGDRFRPVGDFLKSHKDDILDYGQAAEGIYDRYRRTGLENEALGMARDDYARRKPLRDASMAGLLDQSRPDLSQVFADPQNPQGRYRVVNVGSR